MQTYRDMVGKADRPPLVVAHRGAWTAGPENSLLAIRRAFEAGHDIVEIDIQESADGVLFLMHDDTVDRMTEGAGLAADKTMAELSELRLRNGAGGAGVSLSDQPVPTLADVLALSDGRGCLDLDVKHDHLIEKVAAFAAGQGARGRVNVKFPLRSEADLTRLQRIEAETGVMVMPMLRLDAGTWRDRVDLVRQSGAAITEVKFDSLETLRAACAVLHEGGTAVWVNTLDPVASVDLCDRRAMTDPDSIWGVLVAVGVSVFQTDIPDQLAAWIRRNRVQA